MAIAFFLIYLMGTLLVLYRAINPIVWEMGSVLYLVIATFFIGLPLIAGLTLWFLIISTILIVQFAPLRVFIGDYLYRSAGKSLPKLSKTEEEALNAGDTWLEQDIFIGQPNWDRLASIST